MLRSMLYVRYGSGCNREVTAWAARPRACRSWQANSSTPSSVESRLPSTAFDKIRGTVELKVHPFRGQPEVAGQLVEPGQPGQLPRAEVEAQDVAQVAPAKARV